LRWWWILKQIPSNVEADSETNLHSRIWRFWLGNVHELSVLSDNHVEYVVVSLRHYNRFKKNLGKYSKRLSFMKRCSERENLSIKSTPIKG